MSDRDPNPPDEREEPAQGPNLALMYGLIALAMVAAIGLAVMIVAPFYLRR